METENLAGYVDKCLGEYLAVYEKLSNVGEGKASIALGILHEACKDRRTAALNKNRNEANNDVQAEASDKQLALLKQLGATVNKKLTKKEASEMIQVMTKKQ